MKNARCPAGVIPAKAGIQKTNKINIAVVGGYKCSKKVYALARELGELIAQEGWVLVCGGSSGVMEAACRGAKNKNGLTVGILPSLKGEEANPYLDVVIPTGLGYGRNILVVRSAKAIVAVDGKYGTLSEIAFALNEGRPVLGINTWNIKGVKKVKTAKQAVSCIKRSLR